MRRLRVGLLISIFAILLICVPAHAIEKKTYPGKDNSKNFEWSIYGETGFQHTELHFDAPFVAGAVGTSLYLNSPLKLELHNADAWYGGIGTAVKIGRFSAFAEGKATLPRETNVGTDSEPFWAGQDFVIWNHSRMNWWAVNGGLGVDVTRNFTVQAGLKYERLSLGLPNPVDTQGLIASAHDSFGDTYSADLVSKLLIPWIGVQAQGYGLSGSVRFSPFARVDLQIPFTYATVVSATQTTVERENYAFEHNGTWLEANLAYDLYKGPSWTCSLWAQGTWLWVKGDTVNTYLATDYQQGSPAATLLSSTGSVDSNYYNATYTMGLRVGFNIF